MTDVLLNWLISNLVGLVSLPISIAALYLSRLAHLGMTEGNKRAAQTEERAFRNTLTELKLEIDRKFRNLSASCDKRLNEINSIREKHLPVFAWLAGESDEFLEIKRILGLGKSKKVELEKRVSDLGNANSAKAEVELAAIRLDSLYIDDLQDHLPLVKKYEFS